jgi:hypothetical protein
MKIRLLVALAGLAISYALPTFAQKTNTPDPQLRQQIIAFLEKFNNAWNNNDPVALARFTRRTRFFAEEMAQDRIMVAKPSRNTLRRGSIYFISATILPRPISISSYYRYGHCCPVVRSSIVD